MIARAVLVPLLVPLLAALLSALPGGTSDAPSAREQQALAEEYFALDWKSPQGIARHDEILAALDSVPALTEREVETWTKKLAKLWSKGPELEKKSGRHHLWEDEERGLYILGGRTRKPEALFVGMHGGGLGSGEANGAASNFGSAVSSLDWLGVFPEVLEKTEHGWTDSGTEEFVLELVERARRTFDIDPDRVFFGGHSMGGYGTWTLGAHHADTVAALTPSAGAPTPVLDGPGGSVIDVEYGVIPNLRNVPMVVFQSADDPRVPPDVNRVAVRRVEEARARWGGFELEYWEVDGNGHDLPPGGAKALLEKVADRVREPYPERVVWQPALTWKRQFYWLWWDAPEVDRIVVADLDREANTIEITADGPVEGLWILLREELVDMEREVVVELNGEEVRRELPRRTLAALLSTARFGDPRRTYPARLSVSAE